MTHVRLRLVDLAVRWRFKRHAHRPLDVAWARQRIGRPEWIRTVITPAIQRHDVFVNARRVEVLQPPLVRGTASLERAVLYVHGGGYIACSPVTHRPLAARLAREWRAVAVVPDYRLAPEGPFPAGRDDVLATYAWMLETLGVPAAAVVFAGDSAGGGLAIAAALACADAGLPAPGAVVGFSPWADLACTGASILENVETCAMFSPAQLHAAARLYAGRYDTNDPRVSPVYADLSPLPPLCVHASTDELLRDDTLRLAERAAACGVPVACRTWSGVPHAWQFLAGILPEARHSLDEAQKFVQQYVPARDLSHVPARVTERATEQAGETVLPQA